MYIYFRENKKIYQTNTFVLYLYFIILLKLYRSYCPPYLPIVKDIDINIRYFQLYRYFYNCNNTLKSLLDAYFYKTYVD